MANIFSSSFPACECGVVHTGVHHTGGVQHSLYSKATTPRKFSARQSAGERSWASLDKTKQQNVSGILISNGGAWAVKR